MATLEQRLAEVDRRIARWRPRFTRASNEMSKLLRQRDRLVREASKQIGLPAPPPRRDYDQIEAAAKALVEHRVAEIAVTPSLDIPQEFLRRGQAAQAAVDKIIDEANEKPVIDPRTAKRLAKNDEKRRGRSRFSSSDMPLSGAAALKAIKAAKRT